MAEFQHHIWDKKNTCCRNAFKHSVCNFLNFMHYGFILVSTLTQPLVTLIRIKAVSSSCVPQDEEIKCFAAKLFLNREVYFKDLHTEFLLKEKFNIILYFLSNPLMFPPSEPYYSPIYPCNAVKGQLLEASPHYPTFIILSYYWLKMRFLLDTFNNGDCK